MLKLSKFSANECNRLENAFIFVNTVIFDMGIAERRIRQKEELKLSILEAAWQMVITDGWQSLSIRKIADAIEYSIPVIYNHFENKEAILLEFTKEGFDKLAIQLQSAKDKFPSPSEQLEAMAHAYWDFAFEHKEYYQIMFGLGIPACEQVNQIAEVKNATQVMVSSIQEAINLSNKPDTDFYLKYHTYISILHGLVSIQMIQDSGKPCEKQRNILQDAMNGFITSIFN